MECCTTSSFNLKFERLTSLGSSSSEDELLSTIIAVISVEGSRSAEFTSYSLPNALSQQFLGIHEVKETEEHYRDMTEHVILLTVNLVLYFGLCKSVESSKTGKRTLYVFKRTMPSTSDKLILLG